MGNNFREALEEELKNEEFRLEYEALKPEYDVVKAVLEARQQAELRRCIMGKAVSSGIIDYDREYIEQKLDESDRTAKESDVRLSHDEVFSNARAIIYSEPDGYFPEEIRKKHKLGEYAGPETIEYKGYTGSIEWSEDDNLYYGKVLNVTALISYEGKTIAALEKDFRVAVDYYIELCSVEGIVPEK